MKKFALTLLAAGLISGNASAASINVLEDGSFSPVSGNVYNLTVANPPLASDSVGVFNLFLNTTEKFRFSLGDTVLDGFTATYKLDNLAPIVLSELGFFFSTLTAGAHTLTITNGAGEGYLASITQVSAVPLPAAALLFASSLFGAGALRRKKQQETAEMVAA